MEHFAVIPNYLNGLITINGIKNDHFTPLVICFLPNEKTQTQIFSNF